MTGHDHNNPRQALPLFRLMTWIDPQFINGWAVGAAVLAMGKDKLGHEQAAEFLQQGLEQNPESITLLNQLGFTYTPPAKVGSRNSHVRKSPVHRQ